MDTLSVRRGATLPLQVVSEDPTAETATLTVKITVDDASPAFTKTVNFVEIAEDTYSADLTVTDEETSDIVARDYMYMITVTYTDGHVDKYPESEDCIDCGFPKLSVCKALDAPEVS